MHYVALLRGINVGGRSIKMTELKILFENLGFKQVKTFLQSGNVVFTAEKSSTHKHVIEDALSKQFHYPAKVQVYSLLALKDIVDANPFASDVALHSYVIFFEDGLEEQLMREVHGLDEARETVRVGDGVIYWRVQKGLTLKSEFAKYLVKTTYKNYHTNRNINTLQKILKAPEN